MLTDPKEIKDWLDKMEIENYSIRPDGIMRSTTNPSGLVVDVDDSVDLYKKPILSIPVQFGKVSGGFNCSYTNVSSFGGFPFYVDGNFYCYNTKIESLQGIHKIIKRIDGWFYGNRGMIHILGLLLIPGITGTFIDGTSSIDKIMNKYLGTGDIISAQDELIDAGFKEQAKL